MANIQQIPGFGDLCHFLEGRAIAAAITDLSNKIIVSTGDADIQDSNLEVGWQIAGLKTTTTRLMAVSTAHVILTCPLTSLTQYPRELPKSLWPEREVVIWIGHVPGLRKVEASDLGSWLLPVFLGVIDISTVTGSGTGGITATVQLRDRMRWLMDSSVVYNPDHKKEEKPVRSKIILELAQRSIGQAGEDGCETCGKTIVQSSETVDIATGSDVPEANSWYGTHLKGRTRTDYKFPANPEFRIFSTRRPIDIQKTGDYVLAQDDVMSAIRYLSMQEVFPTEVFQHIDGHFYYAPRGVDITGLNDPKRFNRTYYYRNTGSDIATSAQMLLSIKEAKSSLSLKTNILIAKIGATSSGTQEDYTLQLRIRPHLLDGVDHACKVQRVTDNTIQSVAEAAVVAMQTGRATGKELRDVTLVMLGDPSIQIGEVIQVLGSPYQSKKSFESKDSDRKTFFEYISRYSKLLVDYAKEAFKDAGASDSSTLETYDNQSLTIEPNAESQKNVDALLCSSDNRINFKEEPQTVFRVDGITHKFNLGSKGFTTELLLSSPF